MIRRTAITLLTLLCSAIWFMSNTDMPLAAEYTSGSGEITLIKGQGRLVRLNSAASSVFIANPEIADVTVKSSRMVYVFGVKTGTTSLFAVDKNENVIADIGVAVTHDMDRLARGIESLLPAGGVTATSVATGIILEGSVASSSDAENLNRLAHRFIDDKEEVVNRLNVTEPNQVNVRVRFAEVSRTAIKRIGVNFDLLSGDFSFTSGDVFLDNPQALSGLAPFFTLPGGTFGSGAGTLASGSTSILALFDVLEEIGLSKTLAEPNLTAITGETASFLAGGEFPIPVAQDDNTITVEFKEFGVSLAFTPTVLNHNRISMRVRPEVSQLSDAGAITLGGLNIRALSTRRAETTIELASGQSFAIAGLLQDEFIDTVRQVPYLGDVPLLGELFKSESFRRNESELIIVVTPYIVQPVASRDMPLPTDPLTKAPVEIATARERKTSASLSRTVQVPIGTAGSSQIGAATYLLD